MNRISRSAAKAGRSAALTEVSFVVFPIAVTLFVLLVRDEPKDILMSPEWAFAAAILAGQSAIRLAQIRGATQVVSENVDLASAAVLMLYAASVAVLIVIMLAHGKSHPPAWQAVTQMLLFGVNAAVFIVLATLAHANVKKD